MSSFDAIKKWYRQGYWFDTPQGICTLLSFPICWLAALASFLWPVESRPVFLSAEPALCLFAPILAFLTFLRLGQIGEKRYSSSLLSTIGVLVMAAMPFYTPYLHSHGG